MASNVVTVAASRGPGESSQTSSSSAAVLGPHAADCANATLKAEVKKLYAAIFKKLAPKEGGIKNCGGPLLGGWVPQSAFPQCLSPSSTARG